MHRRLYTAWNIGLLCLLSPKSTFLFLFPESAFLLAVCSDKLSNRGMTRLGGLCPFGPVHSAQCTVLSARCSVQTECSAHTV